MAFTDDGVDAAKQRFIDAVAGCGMLVDLRMLFVRGIAGRGMIVRLTRIQSGCLANDCADSGGRENWLAVSEVDN